MFPHFFSSFFCPTNSSREKGGRVEGMGGGYGATEGGRDSTRTVAGGAAAADVPSIVPGPEECISSGMSKNGMGPGGV